MHERTDIRLNAAARRELKAVMVNRNSPQKHAWRAKIVLLTAMAMAPLKLCGPPAKPRR